MTLEEYPKQSCPGNGFGVEKPLYSAIAATFASPTGHT
jgi:hypothetical protein